MSNIKNRFTDDLLRKMQDEDGIYDKASFDHWIRNNDIDILCMRCPKNADFTKEPCKGCSKDKKDKFKEYYKTRAGCAYMFNDQSSTKTSPINTFQTLFPIKTQTDPITKSPAPSPIKSKPFPIKRKLSPIKRKLSPNKTPTKSTSQGK